jgi:SAM-dependent methyltransferase
MVEGSAPERFNTTAANYVASPHHRDGRSLHRLLELLAPDESMAVLDVAAGTGHTACAFAPRVASVVAYDPARNMLAETRKLAEAQKLANLTTREGVAEAMPFPDGSFDRVVSRIAPHHFTDIEVAVREMARVVKKGGAVAVADLAGRDDPELDAFNHAIEVLHDPTHVRSYTLSKWRSLFVGAGLAVVHEEQAPERPEGLLIGDWCRVAMTPPENIDEIRRLCLGAGERLREAFGIRREGEDVRIATHLVAIVVGRRATRIECPVS